MGKLGRSLLAPWPHEGEANWHILLKSPISKEAVFVAIRLWFTEEFEGGNIGSSLTAV